MTITVGVLALQGGVIEHLSLLRRAADYLSTSSSSNDGKELATLPDFDFIQVRTKEQLAQCDALIIPGGESTTMAIVARRLGLFDQLRDFVKVQHKPVWGTCAGLVMLAEEASAVKKGGQELVGGLDVRVVRNRYGTQIQSFVADLKLPFLGEEEAPFRGVFIRAPVVEEIMTTTSGSPAEQEVKEGAASASGGQQSERGAAPVEVMGVYRKDSGRSDGGEAEKQQGDDIVAVRQRNVFGTSFHPELTQDVRIHVWWLRQVLDAARHGDLVAL